MSQSLSKTSKPQLNNRASRLLNLITKDNDALGQLYDARICNDISISLYNLRKEKGITQKELAELLQVKQSNISRWEQPGYQGYKVKMLSKIARILGGQLQISIMPVKKIQYIRESFEMKKLETTHWYKSDGSYRRRDSFLEIKYLGETVNESI